MQEVQKYTFTNWHNIEIKDLLPGVKVYRTEGTFTWILSVGQVNDYAVYVSQNSSRILEYAYKHGIKVHETEALRVFPFLVKSNLELRP